MPDDEPGDLARYLGGELPMLPDRLSEHDPVPVARWIGQRLSAVRTVANEDGDLSDDTAVFRRAGDNGDAWIEFNGSGGSEWYAIEGRWHQLEPVAPTAVWWGGTLEVADDDRHLHRRRLTPERLVSSAQEPRRARSPGRPSHEPGQ